MMGVSLLFGRESVQTERLPGSRIRTVVRLLCKSVLSLILLAFAFSSCMRAKEASDSAELVAETAFCSSAADSVFDSSI